MSDIVCVIGGPDREKVMRDTGYYRLDGR